MKWKMVLVVVCGIGAVAGGYGDIIEMVSFKHQAARGPNASNATHTVQAGVKEEKRVETVEPVVQAPGRVGGGAAQIQDAEPLIDGALARNTDGGTFRVQTELWYEAEVSLVSLQGNTETKQGYVLVDPEGMLRLLFTEVAGKKTPVKVDRMQLEINFARYKSAPTAAHGLAKANGVGGSSAWDSWETIETTPEDAVYSVELLADSQNEAFSQPFAVNNLRFSMEAIPEPATFSLIALAGGTLVLHKRLNRCGTVNHA